VSCKRRDCPVCGAIGRHNIAERIAYGVRHIMAKGERCAWLVLTFATQKAERASWKALAVRRLGIYIRWLRRRLGKKVPGKRGRTRIEPAKLAYVATYELTKRRRLHINLIIGPWQFIPQRELQKHWGARLSVEYVKDSQAMGREAAKAKKGKRHWEKEATKNPKNLGGYVSKLNQAVPRQWHRRVSFSKGWPTMPEAVRKGQILWEVPDKERITAFEYLEEKGLVFQEVRPGEYASIAEECDCFHFVVVFGGFTRMRKQSSKKRG
jgi:hypothetical protein